MSKKAMDAVITVLVFLAIGVVVVFLLSILVGNTTQDGQEFTKETIDQASSRDDCDGDGTPDVLDTTPCGEGKGQSCFD
ncbi:MAG: hypothetical protein ACOC32_04295, partial [Nanoarchaeota archaeon]